MFVVGAHGTDTRVEALVKSVTEPNFSFIAVIVHKILKLVDPANKVLQSENITVTHASSHSPAAVCFLDPTKTAVGPHRHGAVAEEFICTEINTVFACQSPKFGQTVGKL